MIEGFNRFKKIIEGNNKARLIELLTAFTTKDSFLEYIKDFFEYEKVIKEINFNCFKDKISDKEHDCIPLFMAKRLYNVLLEQNFNTFDASNPIKWLSISIQAVQNNIIEPSYFAYNGEKATNGLEKLQEIISEANIEKIATLARLVARKFYGAISKRGQKGLYQDMPFAVAWWMYHLSKSLNNDRFYAFFNSNKSIYDELIMRMGSKLTVISDKNIRDALLEYTLENRLKSNEFKKIVAKIGIETSWRLMGILSKEENKNIIGNLAK